MSLRSEPTAREKEGGREGGIGPGQERGNKPDKMKEPKTKNVEKKKGDVERERTKGGKTNVRQMLYVTGLRQTPSVMVGYGEKQFSLQFHVCTKPSTHREDRLHFRLFFYWSISRGCFYVGQSTSFQVCTIRRVMLPCCFYQK